MDARERSVRWRRRARGRVGRVEGDGNGAQPLGGGDGRIGRRSTTGAARGGVERARRARVVLQDDVHERVAGAEGGRRRVVGQLGEEEEVAVWLQGKEIDERG